MKLFAIALVVGVTINAAAFGQSRFGGYGSTPTYGTGSNPSSHEVGGYTTSRGTSVAPHYQTEPNGTQYDNYGSRGNVNPHNGNTGTRSPKW